MDKKWTVKSKKYDDIFPRNGICHILIEKPAGGWFCENNRCLDDDGPSLLFPYLKMRDP